MKNKPRKIELTVLTRFKAISIKSLMEKKYFLLMRKGVNRVSGVSKSKNTMHLSRQVIHSNRRIYPPFAGSWHAFETKRDIEQVFLKNRAALQDANQGAKCYQLVTNSDFMLLIRIVIETIKGVFACFCPFLDLSTGIYRAKMTCFLTEFLHNFEITRKTALETQKLFLTGAILRTRPILRKAEVNHG